MVLAPKRCFSFRRNPKDPEHYVVTLSQSGLSLPDRDNYLNASFARERNSVPMSSSFSRYAAGLRPNYVLFPFSSWRLASRK